MTNTINTLMDSLTQSYQGVLAKDVTTLTAVDIDVVIAYQRKNRANSESGVKAKRETGPKQSLAGVMDGLLKAKPQVNVVKRRI